MLSNHRFVCPIYAVLTGMLSLVYPTIGADPEGQGRTDEPSELCWIS